ncbi:MAG: hypothetical protein IJ126_08285 [Lachnospiraceae bacterium]|nr:hypothetical protein [Lachnospiraceae bacterium]
MLKVEAYYPFTEEPEVRTCRTGTEARDVISYYLGKGAAYCLVTHMETGIRQVYVDGLPIISAASTAAGESPFF